MTRLLLLAYPLLLGAAVVFSMPLLALAAMLLLLAQLLAPALASGRLWAWAALLGIAAGGAFLATAGDGRHIMQMVSFVVFSFMLMIFGRSLRRGQIPLATRVAAAARGLAAEEHQQMDAALLRYTRGVTLFWSIMFALFIAQSLLLAVWAPPAQLGLLFDAGNFVLVVILLGAEYLYHSRRFPNPKHQSFLDFARDVAGQDYSHLLTD